MEAKANGDKDVIGEEIAKSGIRFSLFPHPRRLEIGGAVLGDPKSFCLIAGPCAVESTEQTMIVANAVKEGGAHMFRAGAFKPRTSPHSWQGLGLEGLEILREVRAETGLPIVTELMDTKDADAVAESTDVIQIGARNMQNFPLLTLAGQLGKPTLLKRGMAASVSELLQAAQYILKEGNNDVILCERGIRTFETTTRFTLDLGVAVWLKLNSNLPVIIDPSHAAGDRRLVPSLACAAAASGVDGLIVEVHDDPPSARSDGPQALYASDFGRFAKEVFGHAALRRGLKREELVGAPAPKV